MLPLIILLPFVYLISIKINEAKVFDVKQALAQKWILILLLSAYVGFRYGVGADYFAYRFDYVKFNKITFGAALIHKDPLTVLLAQISHVVFHSVKAFFFGMAFIFIACSVCTIYKYSSDFTLAMILFIVCGPLLESCNASRQYIAVGIVFADYANIKNQRLWWHVAFIIIATMFHSSALVMMPIYFIFSPKASTTQTLMWLGGTAMLMLASFGTLFSATAEVLGKSLDQSHAYFTHTVNALRVLVYIAPCGLLFFTKGIKKRMPSYAVFILFNAILTLVTCRSAYLMRVCMYTNIFLCIAIPDALKDINLPKESVRSIKYVLVTCYTVFWFYGVMTSGGYYPYRFSFFR